MPESTKLHFTVRHIHVDGELPEGELREQLIAEYVQSKEKHKTSMFAGLTGSLMIITRGLDLYMVDIMKENQQ